MTDYRRFLAASTNGHDGEEVLAYFGGPYVQAGPRRLSVRPPGPPGFFRFAVTGRSARVVGPAEPPDLSGWPAVRGYVVPREGRTVYLATDSGAAERLVIGPADEPRPFAPLLARRFPGGELVFDAEEFESGVEDAVRTAYEDGVTLADVKGVPATLRAAFGYAVLLRVARRESVPAIPAEARPHLSALADRGEAAAREVLGLLRAERARVEPDETPQWIIARDQAQRRRAEVSDDAVTRRVAQVLYANNAGLRGLRRLEGGWLEVRYDLDGEQFVSIVEARTLNVADAGICLNQHDGELTLESLPSVIREAIRTGRLHVTAY
jgi:hypothetical protein